MISLLQSLRTWVNPLACPCPNAHQKEEEPSHQLELVYWRNQREGLPEVTPASLLHQPPRVFCLLVHINVWFNTYIYSVLLYMWLIKSMTHYSKNLFVLGNYPRREGGRGSTWSTPVTADTHRGTYSEPRGGQSNFARTVTIQTATYR